MARDTVRRGRRCASALVLPSQPKTGPRRRPRPISFAAVSCRPKGIDLSSTGSPGVGYWLGREQLHISLNAIVNPTSIGMLPGRMGRADLAQTIRAAQAACAGILGRSSTWIAASLATMGLMLGAPDAMSVAQATPAVGTSVPLSIGNASSVDRGPAMPQDGVLLPNQFCPPASVRMRSTSSRVGLPCS